MNEIDSTYVNMKERDNNEALTHRLDIKILKPLVKKEYFHKMLQFTMLQLQIIIQRKNQSQIFRPSASVPTQ